MSEYSEWMAEYQDLVYLQEKAYAGHWANDLLDKPHALISVIETKISRAAIAERERIIKLLEDEELQADLNNSMKHYDQLVWLGIKEQLIALIKGEQK